MSDAWSHLRDFTSARLALGRTGNSLPTSRVLEFQLAHARAQDAVHRPFLPCEIADAIGTPSIAIATRAADRQTYLLDPDSGRTLSDAARARLQRGNSTPFSSSPTDFRRQRFMRTARRWRG